VLVATIRNKHLGVEKLITARSLDAAASHEEERRRFEEQRDLRNKEVLDFAEAYERGDGDAVADYLRLVFERSASTLPLSIERAASVPETAVARVELQLPTLDDLPSIVGYRYVKSRGAIEPIAARKGDREAL
jgi:hypothetical protein